MHFFLIFCFICVLPFQVMACRDIEKTIFDYQTIFEGKVLSTRKLNEEEKKGNSSNWAMRLEILKKYKGTVNDEIEAQYFSVEDFTREQLLNYEERIRPFHRKFEVGEIVRIFTNSTLIKDQSLRGFCSLGGQYEALYFLPLEKFKATADMYAEIADELPYDHSKYMPYSQFYLEQARFHEEYNDFPSALVAYEKALEVSTYYVDDDTNAILEEFIFLDVGYTELFELGIGRIYFKQGKYEDALKMFEKITDNLGKFEKLVDENQDTLQEAKKYRDMTITELEKQNP